VRVCKNGNQVCARNFWDRNVSAALNILPLFLQYGKNGTKPVEFQRGVANNGKNGCAKKANWQKEKEGESMMNLFIP